MTSRKATSKSTASGKTTAARTGCAKASSSKTSSSKRATTKTAKVAATPSKKTTTRRKTVPTARGARQKIRCYLCGATFEVSAKTMSTTCTACHKAIKVEDVQIKSYLPVTTLQTCGHIKVTKRGRVAARTIQSGRGVACEGSLEGSIEADGPVELGPKSSWKGKTLQSPSLAVRDGAELEGHVRVPWVRDA